MCAVRAPGLLEYMRLRGTQRVRFRTHKKRVLMRKARDADVYWSTLGIAHGAGLATSPVENAAHQVPQPIKTRVLTRKAHGADVYWST